MTCVRKFNEKGIIRFEELLDQFRSSKSIDTDKLIELTTSVELTNELAFEVFIETPETNEKYVVSKYLSELLGLRDHKELYRDRGLWTWISAYLLPILVPIQKDTGERVFKEKALYVLESKQWNKYYRHLLAFCALTYTELEQKGALFLRGKVYERGEIVEQLAAVYQIQRNKGIIEAASILFYNHETGTVKKGAASKNMGGTARRFREVLKQFQVTFDLNSMTGVQIVNILPVEFEKWRKPH